MSISIHGIMRLCRLFCKKKTTLMVVLILIIVHLFLNFPQPINHLTPVILHRAWHLRIVVLAFNRSDSLKNCLSALQDLWLDGSPALLEIRIDRSEDGHLNEKVLQVAQNFEWRWGETIVFLQEEHVGIYGQWIYSWQPSSDNPQELAIIVEDDVDLSPLAFRWLKKAHDHYDRHTDVAGYSLVDIEIPLICSINDILIPSSDDTVFKFSRFCTFGFSPKASVWRKFQAWYEEKKQIDSFKPYTRTDRLFTQWYRIFENSNRRETMWSMWFIKFCDEYGLYTVYPNTQMYLRKYHRERLNDTNLAFHRREEGLHFKQEHVRLSKDFLLRKWYPDLVDFPADTPVYSIPHPLHCISLAIRENLYKLLLKIW